LETLVSYYQVKAVRTAYLVTHDEAMAEDVVQEAFVRIYQRIHGFDESRPFETYLMRSVINGALNAVRRQRRSVPLDGNEVEVEALLAKARSVESQVEYTQLQQNLLVAFTPASPADRGGSTLPRDERTRNGAGPQVARTAMAVERACFASGSYWPTRRQNEPSYRECLDDAVRAHVPTI
jgi:RNA polymerase sigma factor (sigma-70 family)